MKTRKNQDDKLIWDAHAPTIYFPGVFRKLSSLQAFAAPSPTIKPIAEGKELDNCIIGSMALSRAHEDDIATLTYGNIF